MAKQNSAEVLAFLDTIGSEDRGDNVSLNNVATELVNIADEIITKASDNMDRKGNVATGGTISSMKVDNIQVNGKKYSLDILIDDNYKFLDQGVRGVDGSGKGKFKFKYANPSKKHVDAIQKWLKRRGVVSKYKAISANERKNKRIKKIGSDRSAAYAVAKSIKKKGIKPTYFFTNAVRDVQKETVKRLGKAFEADIIETLKKA